MTPPIMLVIIGAACAFIVGGVLAWAVAELCASGDWL